MGIKNTTSIVIIILSFLLLVLVFGFFFKAYVRIGPLAVGGISETKAITLFILILIVGGIIWYFKLKKKKK